MQPLSLARFSSLIAELYAAVHTPSRLLGTLRQMEQLLEVDMIHLLVNSIDERRAPLQVVTNDAFNGAAASYMSYYSVRDPRKPFARGKAVGETMFCHHYIDEQFVSSSEFYQEWMIPNGGRYTGGGTIYRDHLVHANISIHHFKGRQPFSGQKAETIALLMPHLVQCMQLWMTNSQLRSSSQLSFQALDALQYGLVALSADGRVVFANTQAEGLLGRMKGEMALGWLRKEGSLWPLLQRCLLQSRPGSLLAKHSSGDVFCLALPAGQARTNIALPLWHQGEAACLLILSTHLQRRVAPAGQLAEIYGLTAAESRLAHTLASGGSLESHAESFCISINTVRTQLRHLLEKTGEARQQDLVRSLSLIPAV